MGCALYEGQRRTCYCMRAGERVVHCKRAGEGPVIV